MLATEMDLLDRKCIPADGGMASDSANSNEAVARENRKSWPIGW